MGRAVIIGGTGAIGPPCTWPDASGHHSNSPVKPDFGGPVWEDQPTVAPSALEISEDRWLAGQRMAGTG